MVVSSPWQRHCDPISTALPFQAVPEAAGEQLWLPPAPWDQVCLCFSFISRASRDTAVPWDVHINRPNVWNGLCSLTVEGSWGARQLALKMSWQCAENCDKMFWALRRTVSNVSSYSAMISECIALGVKGTDIAVNARTPEWNKVEHTELNVAVTLAARFLC